MTTFPRKSSITFKAVPAVVATTWTIFLPNNERIDIVQDSPAPEAWVIRWRLSCWTRAEEWVLEPLRQYRSVEFLELTRWVRIEDALHEAKKAATVKLKMWAAAEERRKF